MAKEDKKVIEAPVINPVPKEGPVDLTKRVDLVATDKHPHRKAGDKISVSQAVADKFKANGWAK